MFVCMFEFPEVTLQLKTTNPGDVWVFLIFLIRRNKSFFILIISLQQPDTRSYLTENSNQRQTTDLTESPADAASQREKPAQLLITISHLISLSILSFRCAQSVKLALFCN